MNQNVRKAFAEANSLSPKTIKNYLERHGVKGIVRVERASLAEDKAGGDYRIHFEKGPTRYVDLKEYSLRVDNEYVVLETAICGKKTRPGWAVDDRKITHYILVVRADKSSQLIRAKKLRSVLRRFLNKWKVEFGVRRNLSHGIFEDYWCEFIYVPTELLLKKCAQVGYPWWRTYAHA